MKDIRKVDKFLLFLILVYSLFGLIMIFSSSSASTVLRYNYSSLHFFIRQLIIIIVSLIGGILILLIPTKKYKFLSYILVIGVGGLLILVLAIGKITNNAQSWFKIMGFTVQPSEFAKTALILFMAYYYNGISRNKKAPLALYFIPMAVAVVMGLLVAIQPDWGSALILLAIAGLTFISVPQVQKNMGKIIKIGIGAVAIVAIILIFKWDSIISAEKLSRFNFSSPCERYKEDTGYQVCNGFIAISNGGLFGVGLGKSSQKYLYLPESHTDFIFPIIVEELGALVGVLIIVGYGLILLKIYKIAKEADNLRNSIICYGTFWLYATHIIINLLGILALIPLTGVPLPLLSYGGSFTLNALVMSFLVLRISIENKKSKISREIASL